MPFEARRLRVQLPCAGSGTLVDVGRDDPDVVADPAPSSSLCPPPPPPGCDAGTSKVPPDPPCGVPSHLHTDPYEGLWDPAILPLLRSQLTARLGELAATRAHVDKAQAQIQGHLRDVSIAERELDQQRQR